MSRFKTHYDNLKVSRDAPPEVIRMAYKALAQKYHPDSSGTNSQDCLKIMQIINASYDVLKDPEKRAAHDKWIEEIERRYSYGGQAARPSTPPVPPVNPVPQKAEAKDSSSNLGCAFFIVIAIALIWSSIANRGHKPVSQADASHSEASKSRSDSGSASPSPNPTRIPSNALPHLSSPKSRPWLNPSVSHQEFDEPKLPLPGNGSVEKFSNKRSEAPLTIKAPSGESCLVKLCNAATGAPELTVFVHAGSSASVDVPLGTYKLKYASGTEWYGPKYLFGPETSYMQAEEILDFRQESTKETQEKLNGLRREIMIADANLRQFMSENGFNQKTLELIFDGTDQKTGDSGVDRIPKEWWIKNVLGKLNNAAILNGIVDRLKARKSLENSRNALRAESEDVTGYTITLHKVRDGNVETHPIEASNF